MQIGLPPSSFSVTNSSARNPFGHDDVLLRLLGRQRLLHLAERLALHAPRAGSGVVRDLLADVVVLERLDVGPLRRSSPGPGTAPSNGDAAAAPRPAASPSVGSWPTAQRMPRSTSSWKPGLPQVRWSWPQAV